MKVLTLSVYCINVAFVSVAFAQGGSPGALTFDAATEFSSGNPSGSWAYGTGTIGTSFTPMTVFTSSKCLGTTGISCWQPSTVVLNSVPVIAHNNTTGTINPASNIVFPTNVLLLHPGPSTDTIVQWRAPQAGTYSITGFFELLDTAPTGIVGEIFINSTSVYTRILTTPAATGPNTVGDREPFSLIQTVAAGSVISFGVNNDGNYLDDSTGFEATITLVNPNAPTLSSGGVLSASSFGGFTSVAPGTWAELYGTNLAATTRTWAGTDFTGVNAPVSLSGTSVTIGGQAAFVDYISPSQVNIQVPSNVGPGPQPVILTTASGTSLAYNITVNPVQPGFLAPSSFSVGGKQYIVALYPDGVTYVLPPGAITGVNSRRAKPADTVIFYGVGFGPVVPTTPAGQIVQQSNGLANPIQILFGGMATALSYSGLAPGYVGLYQFNVVVPNVPASDLVPVTFTLSNTTGTQTLYIAVQN